MRKLIYASLFRTVRWRLFWTELGTALLMPAIILVNSYLQTNLTNAYVYKMISQFFGHAPLVGVFVSVFASKLWGRDYEWGTLRTKLSCGHERYEVYLSYLFLTAMVGLTVTGLWILVYLTLGVPVLGLPGLDAGTFAIYILSDLLLSIAISSICTLLCSVSEQEAQGLRRCLIAVSVMIVLGLILYKRFSIPQHQGWIMFHDDPSTIQPAEAGLYVGGTARIWLELTICMLPGAQGILLLEQKVEHLFLPSACSLLVIVLTTVWGLRLLERKEVK